MNFVTAIEFAMAGEKVRGADWGKGVYVTYEKQRQALVFNKVDGDYIHKEGYLEGLFDLNDIINTWEVYKEPKRYVKGVDAIVELARGKQVVNESSYFAYKLDDEDRLLVSNLYESESSFRLSLNTVEEFFLEHQDTRKFYVLEE